MGYEPRIGDMVLVTHEEIPYEAVIAKRDEIHDGHGRSFWKRPNGAACWLADYLVVGRLTPLHPTEVGQRVRNENGVVGAVDEMVTAHNVGVSCRVVRDDGGRFYAMAHSLIRISDKTDPTKETRKAARVAQGYSEPLADLMAEAEQAAADWPNRPLCGRPGHNPKCLCTTAWVRPPLPEPLVTGPHHLGQEGYWSVGVRGNFLDHPTTSEPDQGRARAIAAWKAAQR